MKLKYKLIDIRTNPRFPGVVYASIVDEEERLCVTATLDYCFKWLEKEVAKAEREIGKGKTNETVPA